MYKEEDKVHNKVNLPPADSEDLRSSSPELGSRQIREAGGFIHRPRSPSKSVTPDISTRFGYDLRVGYYLFYLLRVQFWSLSMGTLYIGWVLASKTMIPNVDIFIGMIVIGPLVGGFALLYNEICDLNEDKLNPRKSSSPLINEMISPQTGMRVALSFVLLAILLSIIVSWLFFLFITLLIILSIAYSHPYLRLKNMGGIDMIVNMIGFGLICPLAGWSLLFPPKTAPFLYFTVIMLVMGGLYAPTTVLDYETDLLTNNRSLAVRLGRNKTLIVSAILIGTAILLAYIESLKGYVITNEIFIKLSPIYILALFFHGLFYRKKDSENITAGTFMTTFSIFIGTLLFLLYYTGLW